MRAAELFDPRHEVAFPTYARDWIKPRMHWAITAQSVSFSASPKALLMAAETGW